MFKKTTAYLAVALGCFAAYAGFIRPVQVQQTEQKRLENIQDRRGAANLKAPVLRATAANNTFSIDDIEFWAGDGLNRAALVIQWNDDREQNALVFGYRFNGEKTGADLIREVVKEYPQLYVMVGHTDDLGYNIGGFGFDNTGKGNFQISDGSQTYTLPADDWYQPDKGYNYDSYSAVDKDNFWKSGWMNAYWSYWAGTPGDFEYSQFGVSNHTLVNDTFYGWNFISLSGGGEATWKAFKAVPDYQANKTTSVTVDGNLYTVTNGNLNTVELTRAADAENIVIPATFTEGDYTYTVTRVAGKAFENLSAKSVTLPETVYYVGDECFAGCANLATVKLPSRLYGIGTGVFRNCTSLAAPVYPAGFAEVPAAMFAGSGVTVLNLPAEVKAIGAGAFEGCAKLAELTFGEDCHPAIAEKAFADCSGLTTVTCNLDEPFAIAATAFDGCTAKLIVPAGAKAGYAAAEGWSTFAERIVEMAPAVEVGTLFTLDGIHYRVAEDSKVYVTCADPSLTTAAEIKKANQAAYTADINIPATVTYQNCDFTVAGLDARALYGAKSESIAIADGVTDLGEYALAETLATSVALPSDLKVIAPYLLYGSYKVEGFRLPDGVEEIGNSAFASFNSNTGSKYDFTVPASVKTIGRAAFAYSAMSEFVQPEGITEIPDSLFMGCTKLTKAVMNDGTKLGIETFRGCSALTEVRLPSDLTVLPKNIFYGNSSLETIELPAGIREIGIQAFANCRKLNIEVPATVTKVNDFAFNNCAALTKLDFSNVLSLGAGAAKGCANVTTVILNDNLKRLETCALGGRFGEMTSLEKILIAGDESGVSRLPRALEYIGHEAFRGDNKLKLDMSAENCSNIRNVRDNAFYECSLIDKMELPAADSIGHEAFYKTAIKEFVIPKTIKTIGQQICLLCPLEGGKMYTLGSPTSTLWQNYSSYVALTYKYGSNAEAALIVPTGYVGKAGYTKETWGRYISRLSTSSGWKYEERYHEINISAPEVTKIDCGENAAVVDRNSVKLSNKYVIEYDMTGMPEMFVRGNNKIVCDAYYVTFSYKKKGESTYTTVPVENDGESFLAEVNGLEPGEYEYFLRARKGQTPQFQSEASTFTISNGLSFEGIEAGSTISLDLMGIQIVKPVYEAPEGASSSFTVSVEDEKIATVFQSGSNYSLVGHNPGTTKVTLTSGDGKAVTEYTVTVAAPEPYQPEDAFADGTFWLNEEWFGHTCGSINYVDENRDLHTRVYGNNNDNAAFGCTSQFATVYADKLIVMSKQAWDGGDTRDNKTGGRCVIADAKTMKRLASFDEIGGDGRAAVGVSPEKAYISHSKGIRVLDLANLTLAEADIEGVTVGRNGQIGNMVKAGNYVYAVNTGTGLTVIDATTDKFVKTIPCTGIQGVAVSADGRVWMAQSRKLSTIDTETLEVEREYSIPGSISCSNWGTWRSQNLYAFHNSNKLFWGSGTLYCWDLDNVDDPSTLAPVYTYSANDRKEFYSAYGTGAVDERTGTYMFATNPGYGFGAVNNWLHFVDLETLEVKRVKMPEYWWFPSMPVFPDKHAPRLMNIEQFSLREKDEPMLVELTPYLSDEDDIDGHIAVRSSEIEHSNIAEASLNGKSLTLTPKAIGSTNLNLELESRGRVVNHSVPVVVSEQTGVSSIEVGRTIKVSGSDIVVTGYDGCTFEVYTLSGIVVANFKAAGDIHTEHLNLTQGVYIVVTSDGNMVKLQVK